MIKLVQLLHFELLFVTLFDLVISQFFGNNFNRQQAPAYHLYVWRLSRTSPTSVRTRVNALKTSNLLDPRSKSCSRSIKLQLVEAEGMSALKSSYKAVPL